MNTNVTIITGLWDLGRGDMYGWGKRDFNEYKNRFFELLETDCNMVIWIPKSLEDDVKRIRGDKNTQIYFKEVEDFKTWFPFFDDLQKIRKDEKWYNIAGWLRESPQASLEYYNPMMMCKMFMLHDTSILNPFNSKYFYWIDGGLTSTVNKGYFTKDKVLDNLDYYSDLEDKFTFLTYPYESNDEIHGFERKKMAEYCNVDFVNYVSRGGFFGGHKKYISKINELYYNILQDTIRNGYMGADECLFTILTHNYPDIIERFIIGGDGLVWPFFEHLKNVREIKKTKKKQIKTSLYILTYNSPNQLKTLLKSFEIVDKNFLETPKIYLLNNSTKKELYPEYEEICKKYDIEEIRKDNIGICGGRQFIAEHFNETDSDYYIFFEDDMNLYPNKDNVCKSGLRRYVDELFNKSLQIIHQNNYDFLKLSFSEFYGDNATQWAWYNVPQSIRELYFPNKSKLPENGLDSDAPRTNFNNIKRYDDLAFIDGEVYYCNWPMWFNREGNRKVFLDIKWSYPNEQTWMSNVFQRQKENIIKSAILLLSPIEHDRFDFYPSNERKES